MAKQNKERRDAYADITNQIIAAIEGGAGEPQMPWHTPGFAIIEPINVASGKPYNGVNVIALWAMAEVNGYTSGLWGTYRQWAEKGAQVKKGEKASRIVFFKELRSDNEADSEGAEARRKMFARSSAVFNVAQVEGFEENPADIEVQAIEPCERAEQIIAASKAKIVIEGHRAFYRPGTDTITMPARERFTGTETMDASEGWYATLLHELTHWSGAKHRLDRSFAERFGKDAYAMEELVAEIGAAFLCARLGVTLEPRPDHAQYIGHWLKVMKGDAKAIFTAASHASKAANFIMEFEPEEALAQAA